MTNRLVFNLFYGARENKADMYRSAYESGADINFQFDGRKATRGGGGRWYYGDTIWYAPDGVDGDKNDTLLHIAVKCNNRPLCQWLLTLERLDVTLKNGKGADVFQVAKDMGRETLLNGAEVALPPPPPMGASTAGDLAGKGASSGAVDAAATGDDAAAGNARAGQAASAGGSSADAVVAAAAAAVAADEATRMNNLVRMLRIKMEERDGEVSRLEGEAERYKQMLREKDADIGELQNSVLAKEREVIVMMHKIERLQAQLSEFTDPRQSHAEKFEGWGEAGYHNAEEMLQQRRHGA